MVKRGESTNSVERQKTTDSRLVGKFLPDDCPQQNVIDLLALFGAENCLVDELSEGLVRISQPPIPTEELRKGVRSHASVIGLLMKQAGVALWEKDNFFAITEMKDASSGNVEDIRVTLTRKGVGKLVELAQNTSALEELLRQQDTFSETTRGHMARMFADSSAEAAKGRS